jgi:hypothetical protein
MNYQDLGQELSDNHTYARHFTKGLGTIKFWLRIYWNYFLAKRRLRQTIKKGSCYYGPFKGEFGHMTAHTAPFLMYLHHKGVKIIYCGMELHMPLLVNDKKESIIHDFRPLRDFFAEIPPRSNEVIPPADVQAQIALFEQEAKASGLPFWNIGDPYYYYFIHRNWLLKGYTYLYDLEKAYQTADEFSVCIFPRSKGPAKTINNGERWDYQDLIDAIRPYVEKVYICGHPSQSESLKGGGNVEFCVSTDNRLMLEKTANSKLIITQHSGINNIGEYTNCKVLIIYKGGSKPSDIGSMANTLRFRPSIGTKHELSFAFSMNEIVTFVKEFRENYGQGFKKPG